MAKKKIANPIFLEFINYPLIDKEIFKLSSRSNGKLDADDKNFGGSYDCARGCLEYLRNKSDLPADHVVVLNDVLGGFDNINNELVESIASIASTWSVMRIFVKLLVVPLKRFPDPNMERLKKFPLVSELFQGVEPVLYRRNDADGYEIKIEPATDQTDDSLSTSKLTRIIGADFTNFFLKRYKPGIFAPCELDGCDKIIITANGSKYCCRSHVQKASREKIKKDKNKYLYKKERERLRKKFIRDQSKDKGDREEYIHKNWNKKIKHLYKPPQK